MNNQYDVVVVGSGPAGVHAIRPLINAGLKVAIVDGGLDSKKQDRNLNEFLTTRFTEKSAVYDIIRKSSHVFNRTYELLKIDSNIEIIQSLAKGGLSEQWHGICDFFSPDELEKVGLPIAQTQQEYKEIAEIINLKSVTNLDPNNQILLEVAKNNPTPEYELYQAALAYPYRTGLLIEKFKKFENFTYLPNQLVTYVNDKGSYVEIESHSIDKAIYSKINTKYLILAAGSINTTKILLKSLGLYNFKTSFLTKAHYITACLYPKVYLKPLSKKLGAGQLVISNNNLANGLDSLFVQLYRFNPLAINKAAQHIPLPKFVTLPLFSVLAPYLMIADIRFAAFEAKNKYCQLIKNGQDDILQIFFNESQVEKRNHETQFRKITNQLKSWNLFPIKTIKDYMTSHYAGGVPFLKSKGRLSVDPEGRVHQARRIYVADSSSWRALPAKPPTLTIMANAARIGKNVLKNFPRK